MPSPAVRLAAAAAGVVFPTSGYQRTEVCFAGSGAIAQVQYGTTTTTEETTWGRVKGMYR